MLSQSPVKVEDNEFLRLFPVKFPDSRHQVQHRLRLIGADIIHMMPHSEIGQIIAVDRPENCLETSFMGLVEQVGPVHHHSHMVGHSGVTSLEQFLSRESLAAGDRDDLCPRTEPQDLVTKVLAE